MALNRTSRWRWLLLAVVLLPVLVAPAPGLQGEMPEPARSLGDPRLGRLRQASAAWELRGGPRREVVDVVCLVPDAATFLEALGAWDDAHWFPILIEDLEYTPKFLRAFRPAQVVRYPGRAEPVGGASLWTLATTSVGRSWSDTTGAAPAGDLPPRMSRRTPPGIVLSHPDSPSLTGAAALAAGRFQPLVRWESAKGFRDLLSSEEAQELARDLRATVARVIPDHERLGDACDFLTLALDYPYRYEGNGVTTQAGPAAFDDLIGRHLDFADPNAVRIRWAFAGRLLGDEVQSAYAAMCSLFLQPNRATLINTYGQDRPFNLFDQEPAADRLRGLMPVQQRGRGQSDLTGWHAAFDPVNRAGLVLINSAGNAGDFRLGGTIQGRTWDVPLTEPAIVYKVHSFSAQRPSDPETIAGRWLANGAYIYFGSAHEPYLTSFRTPELVVDLLARGLPFGAAVRMFPEEIPEFGNCWRLAYLGDPLFRLDTDAPRRRLGRWPPLSDWPVYDAPEAPAEPDDPFALISWSVRVAVEAARRGEPAPESLLRALTSLDRDAFEGPLRDYRDLLIADTLAQRGRLDALRAELGRWPSGTLSPAARRWLQSARVASLQEALAADAWDEATAIWDETARSEPSADLLRSMTERVRPPGDQADRVRSWQALLRARARSLGDGERGRVVEEELERIKGKAD